MWERPAARRCTGARRGRGSRPRSAKPTLAAWEHGQQGPWAPVGAVGCATEVASDGQVAVPASDLRLPLSLCTVAGLRLAGWSPRTQPTNWGHSSSGGSAVDASAR